MNRILKYITLVLSAMTIHSCSYDYEMPDLSNAAPTYSVSGVSEELRQVLIEDAKEYGLTFKYAAEQWRTIVREKDEHGNILYEGDPRGKADKNATILQVSYICSCMLQTANWNYYDICQFDFLKDFKLEISPYACEASLTSRDTYTKKVADNHPYSYNVDSSQLPCIKLAESVGYKIMDVKMYITEKDGTGNVLREFKHRSVDGMIYTTAARYIDVRVEVYGAEPYNTDIILVGTYRFSNISLKEINGTTLMLSTDMEHELEKVEGIYHYNVDSSQLPCIKLAESVGYKIMDVKMYITEKDGTGNVLREFKHRSVDGMIYTTAARYIDVRVEVYGAEPYNTDIILVGTYRFSNISLKEINGTTLMLSTDMEHEYVSGS